MRPPGAGRAVLQRGRRATVAGANAARPYVVRERARKSLVGYGTLST